MTKNPKKKAPKRKSRAKFEDLQAFVVRVSKPPKTTLLEIENAIDKKLSAERTEVLRTDDPIIIVIDKEGGRDGP